MGRDPLGFASRGRDASVGGVGEEQAEVLGVFVGATEAAVVLGVRGVPGLSVLEGKNSSACGPWR